MNVNRVPRQPRGPSPSGAHPLVHLTCGPDRATAWVEGEVDLANENQLRRQMADAVAAVAHDPHPADQAREMVLDLSGLSFCSLGGLVVLDDTIDAGRAVGLSVTVTGASATVERVWAILGRAMPVASRPVMRA